MNLTNIIQPEFLKIRRTAVISLGILMAVSIPMLFLYEYIIENKSTTLGDPNPWSSHFIQGRQYLNIFLLPLFIIITGTLLPQLEFKNQTWKQVFVSPQRLSSIYLAKFLVFQVLIISFLLLFVFCMLVVPLLSNIIIPDLNFFDFEFELQRILLLYVTTYISILGISAIQFCLGLKYSNFIVPVFVGLVLWFAGSLTILEFANIEFGKYFPFTYPLIAVFPRFESELLFSLGASVAYCIIILWYGYCDFNKKQSRT